MRSTSSPLILADLRKPAGTVPMEVLNHQNKRISRINRIYPPSLRGIVPTKTNSSSRSLRGTVPKGRPRGGARRPAEPPPGSPAILAAHWETCGDCPHGSLKLSKQMNISHKSDIFSKPAGDCPLESHSAPPWFCLYQFVSFRHI